GGREIGVAAAEEQKQRVVAVFGSRLARWRLLQLLLLAAPPGGLAATGVDEPPGRGRLEPTVPVARRVLGPHPQRLEQRGLQRVLGGIEVLSAPNQTRKHAGDEGAQRALVKHSRLVVDHAGSAVCGRSHMISRTSIHSYSGSPPGPGAEEA